MTGASPELTLVVPTYDERENVRPLVDLIGAALAGLDWELIFVDDDSPDGTAQVVVVWRGELTPVSAAIAAVVRTERCTSRL